MEVPKCRDPDGYEKAAERPAPRTGATQRGPRPPGASCLGSHERAHQADTGRGHLRAIEHLALGEEREPGTQKPPAGSSTAPKR